MSLKHDIEARAMQKLAGIMDGAGNLMGNGGTLSSPIMAAGGAGIGAMAGKGLGLPGMIGGGLLGGLMGYSGANAINQQGAIQGANDMALMNGVGGALQTNDMTNMAQSQAIAEQGSAINTLASTINSMLGVDTGMGMDPSMGMDPAMMAPPAPPSNPSYDQTENNGLGKQGSLSNKLAAMLRKDIAKVAAAKLAESEGSSGSWLPAIGGMGAAGVGAGLGGMVGELADKPDSAMTILQEILDKHNKGGENNPTLVRNMGNRLSSIRGAAGKVLSEDTLKKNPNLLRNMGAVGGAGALGLGAYGLGKLLLG